MAKIDLRNSKTRFPKTVPREDKWYDKWCDPEERTFLGKTPTSWAKITCFYLFFFTGLACYWGICWFIFETTLEKDKPKWTLQESLIGPSPALGFLPRDVQNVNPGSLLIWYKRSSPEDVDIWISQINDFIRKNSLQHRSLNLHDISSCNYERGGKVASVTRSCAVMMDFFGTHCTPENKFGFPTGEPCIILKINKIYGWKPEGFGLNEEGKFSQDLLYRDLNSSRMPELLKMYIHRELQEHHSDHPESFLNTVWISCDGEYEVDKENIQEIKIHPQPGVPGYYFPYYGQKGYQTPFVFLQLLNPSDRVLLNIECIAWAKNIIYDKEKRLGSVHLEVLID